MKNKKSLIDKMRTQLKKEEKKKELEIEKNKNNIIFEEESTNTKIIPKI
jgi:hypothetical protein|tara:strand:+ start:5814 stop:5960 length:147 start_codon:yes stop_codon:yes gene_type:complete